MVLTDSRCAPSVDHAGAGSRHFNNIPLDQLAAFRDELVAAYIETRNFTERLSEPLTAEQQCVQSMTEASPVKWHRAHTSWFFETFLLQQNEKCFKWFDNDYCYFFNSYYNAIGKQYPRAERGQMVQAGTAEIGAYRQAVDQRMIQLLNSVDEQVLQRLAPLVLLGLNHEQQHQELILTDFQHAWSLNPGSPAPWPQVGGCEPPIKLHWLNQTGGLINIGYSGTCFAFDNESPAHNFWLEPFTLANRPVLNSEYLAFLDDGGYENPLLWLVDGWTWIQQNDIRSPLYWNLENGVRRQISCCGAQSLDLDRPLVNISFYEASAFATWTGARLPTEQEWEHAMTATGAGTSLYAECTTAGLLPGLSPLADSELWLGNTWEWTASPYVAYPRFQPGSGAVGEYNGKFMSNQMVLRGYSGFTSPGHSRPTYRNFFYPQARWQQSGFRLARNARV